MLESQRFAMYILLFIPKARNGKVSRSKPGNAMISAIYAFSVNEHSNFEHSLLLSKIISSPESDTSARFFNVISVTQTTLKFLKTIVPPNFSDVNLPRSLS